MCVWLVPVLLSVPLKMARRTFSLCVSVLSLKNSAPMVGGEKRATLLTIESLLEKGNLSGFPTAALKTKPTRGGIAVATARLHVHYFQFSLFLTGWPLSVRIPFLQSIVLIFPKDFHPPLPPTCLWIYNLGEKIFPLYPFSTNYDWGKLGTDISDFSE